MKRTLDIRVLGILSIGSLFFGFYSFALLEVPEQSTIYSENQNEVLDVGNMGNPIREGVYAVIKNPDGEGTGGELQGNLIQGKDQKIEDHETAQRQTLQIIKNLINYALGLVSLIALLYMIYHGILMITAAGDDTQYKKGMKGIKFAAIAIIGIGLSWIFISTIFWVLNNVLLKK